jgi:hypothetical protein
VAELYIYISNLGPYETVGILGFICYISVFGAVQLGMIDGNSAAYSIINVVAASLGAVSLLAEFNLASALIQGSWITIGITGLMLRVLKVTRNRRHIASQSPFKAEVP